MKQNLKIAILMTIVTTVLLGIIYPLVVTGLAQVLFRDKANGQLIVRNGQVVGSRIIGQAFTGPGYLHSRPSAAGTGYDAANSGGTNLGPTNRPIDRPREGRCGAPAGGESWAASSHRSGDHVGVRFGSGYHSSGSGIPGAAHRSRTRPESRSRCVRSFARATQGRQLGFLGEPRVNVLEVNLALDQLKPMTAR